jgi:predicted nuclease of restriction endonuclease-like RecB superfamily/ribosomal protein S13
MFSRALLVTRKRRPYISPVYIHPEETELPEKIMKIYERGKVKERIDEETSLLETHKNFRVVRGLSELLRRKTTFEASYSVDPKALRRHLYERGYVITERERNATLLKASQEFGILVDDIERSFWADREEYLRVGSLADISASELIRYYNLSLTQTLLFDALSLEFSTSGNYQGIFRTIKFLGLMYEVQSEDETVTVRVTGPASLFKKTKKYGTSLARLVPQIMKAPSWNLKAQIETMVAGEPRIYVFELSDSRKEIFPEVVSDDIERFDSSVEEDFVKRFSSLRKDWKVIREPTILKTGPTVMIPDFSLERRKKRCYIEIVGFWTPEYLEKKTEKVKALQEKITLCVSRELQCTKRDFQKENVDIIFYDKKVPMKPILEKIRKIEAEQLEEEKERLLRTEIELKEDIIQVEALAEMYGVGVESVKKVLEKSGIGAIAGDKFIKNPVLEEIRQKLENLEDMRLSSVRKILDEHGLDEHVLKKIGFSIEWRTLDVEDAIVKKLE